MLVSRLAGPRVFRAMPVLSRGIKASSEVAPAYSFQPAPSDLLRVPVVQLEGDEELEIIELDPEVFGVPVRRDVIHQVAVWHRANRRKGTASSKTRGQVKGSTRKLFAQKGGGRARRGDIKSPVLVGGGKAHGPKPRDWSYSMPKKLLEGRLTIVDNLGLSEPKTKLLHARLSELGLLNALFVDGEEFHEAPDFLQASRNIPWVQLVSGLRANTLDILRRENLVLTRRAVAHLEDRLRLR